MAQPQTASFLFTQDLRGDLQFLPKLSRVLMRLRIEDRRTLTVDLGGTCTPDVWHCQATDGRSMLVALDGLNYAAVNTEGLREHVRPHLSKALIHLEAVDSAHPAIIDHVRVVSRLPSDGFPDAPMVLVIRPHTEALVSGNTIRFPAIERYQVGRMRVRTDLPLELISLEMFDVPPETPPDPIISGMVDFIEVEARQYLKRKGQT